MTRDWSKERWRKQCVREPLQQRLWPVMARGLRELLNALAEDDGTLVSAAGDPVEALVRALGPHADEVELVRAAIELLFRQGFLAGDARSIRIPDLPRAQAWPEVAEPDVEAVRVNPPARGRTSTERVRKHRQGARSRNAAGVSPGVSSPVSPGVSSPVSPGVSLVVTSSVSPSVSSSRGDSQQDASETVNRDKDREKDHRPQKRGRARSSVTSSVSPVSSAVASGVSGEDDDDDETSVSEDPDAQERAALVLANPKLAAELRP